MLRPRMLLQILGGLAIVVGLIWAAQGSGYFPYPKSSFMIDQTAWIWRGLGLAIAGLVVVIAARRRA
jgi:hypothetical protein